MNSSDSQHVPDRADEATSKRLGRLRASPIDVTRLREAVDAHIAVEETGRSWKIMPWLTPFRAAASLMLFALIAAIVVTSSSGPVLASADRLAQVHGDVVSMHGGHVTLVSSIEAANAALSAEWKGAPAVPELPDDQVMSCCVHRVGHKKMACVALTHAGARVTVAVAASADVDMPKAQTISVQGVEYVVQSHGNLNMAMTERGGRWVCVMGELPTEQLIELANKFRY